MNPKTDVPAPVPCTDTRSSNHRGYLIIHDISYEEACELYKSLKQNFKLKKMYWWSFEDLAKIDEAAGYAILTHGFPKPEAPVRVSE